jgi:transcriptional regulator with XRE-family HTH domain
MLTGGQIRAARAFLQWSVAELAEKAAVERHTIMRIEKANGVPATRAQTLNDLKTILEVAGIEFMGTPEDAPGVRYRSK